MLLLTLAATVATAQPIPTPSLINPRLRLDPVPSRPGVLRFLTTDDEPPFNFLAPDGTLSGFSVDLSRALCQQMKVSCTIQARRADLLTEAMVSGSGDVAIPSPAGLTDARLALTLPFLPRAARFAMRQGAPELSEATAAALKGRTVGVVAGSVYATFLERYFPETRPQTFPTSGALLDAFAKGSIELVFADAADLAFWLNGVSAAGCCSFVPGSFVDAGLFGAGLTMATRAGDEDLRRAIDGALTQLDANGVITELYLRYFPVPLF